MVCTWFWSNCFQQYGSTSGHLQKKRTRIRIIWLTQGKVTQILMKKMVLMAMLVVAKTQNKQNTMNSWWRICLNHVHLQKMENVMIEYCVWICDGSVGPI